jgi:hypothetical protein
LPAVPRAAFPALSALFAARASSKDDTCDPAARPSPTIALAEAKTSLITLGPI